ncbi:hypothetical protein ACFQ4K_15635 [Tistrella bauzanensis]
MTTQITAIVTLAVMLGAVLTVIAITLLSDSGQKSSPSVIAARAAMIVQLVDASAHHGDVVRIVETARAQGIDVALVDGPPPARRADGDDAPLRSVSFRLEAGWGWMWRCGSGRGIRISRPWWCRWRAMRIWCFGCRCKWGCGAGSSGSVAAPWSS